MVARDACGSETLGLQCKRCVVAKGRYLTLRTPMGSIIASKQLEVLAMDFTQLEPATDSLENALLLTGVFNKVQCGHTNKRPERTYRG